ncbi:MAG: NAD(P)/FAD-dependent oxidoreductase [Flavobacteriaceae bacterium]|jgi:glycine/D-amino acid oxidase-like deaminating enzyme
MLSYWEKSTLLDFDYTVIGGGLVGCFAALTYTEAHPKAKVALIERGFLPSGASTKNAGFACFGSLSELEDDLKDCSLDELVEITERRYKGILHLRAALGDEAIGYFPSKGFELCFDDVNFERMAFFNKALLSVFGSEPFSDHSSKLKNYPFDSQIKGLIAHAFEGTVHTGKLMNTLYQKLGEIGVRVFTGTELLKYDESESRVQLEVTSGQQRLDLKAQKVAFCTNAFTQSFFPDLDIYPGRGLVLVTKPVAGLHLEGSFHYHSGYNYFRAIDQRILLGGARHLDKSTETTHEFGTNPLLRAQLVKDLNEFILPGYSVEVDYEWSGIMAFGKNKQPIIQKISDRVAVAARLGGMGVALSSLVGKEVAEVLN